MLSLFSQITKLIEKKAMNPKLFFVNDGGSSRYSAIAQKYNWLIGMNSGSKNQARLKLEMIDNHWKDYNHQKHLQLIKQHCPHLASCRDLEFPEQVKETFNQAHVFLNYATKVILIPKFNCVPSIEKEFGYLGDRILLGYPAGRYEDPKRLKYFGTRFQIHLLGGSFKRLASIWEHLGEQVYSLDSNYASRIAGFGKICTRYKSRIPHQLEVPSGTDFNYRCFDFSMKLITEHFLDRRQKQLSIF